MFLMHHDAKYIDVMERILYNSFADGVSLKGYHYFYQNPLKSFGNYERFDWIDVPCCPPNVGSHSTALAYYIYAQSSVGIYVNLFVDGSVKIKSASDNAIVLRQETRYPWDGSVKITVEPARAELFCPLYPYPWLGPKRSYAGRSICTTPITVMNYLHLPLNGKPLEFSMEVGYARIQRKWKKGDVIHLNLPMPVRRVQADAKVAEDRDMVALQRGPLVYCAEWPDNEGHALNILVPDNATFKSQWRPDLLGGMQVITGNVQALMRKPGSNELLTQAQDLNAIPYYAWSNRGMGEMAVWLARTSQKAWLAPVPPDPIAAVRSSGGVQKHWTRYNDQNDDIRALYDGKDPLSSADESIPVLSRCARNLVLRPGLSMNSKPRSR